jgi:hypothetical protein
MPVCAAAGSAEMIPIRQSQSVLLKFIPVT